MSWGGSPSCGFDLSSESINTKQCSECKYFKHGWFGIINPLPNSCSHPKHKKRHNRRIQSKYYNTKSCDDFIMVDNK